MGGSWKVVGGAPSLYLADGVPLLHPEQQVFEAMLDGWRDQQLSRNLKVDTIKDRVNALTRFQRFTAEWPWLWRVSRAHPVVLGVRG